MEAGKACDAFGLAAGHSVEQADAAQAYIHAQLKGVPTWVHLPKERWPEKWAGMRDPVCPLILALYGHPDSGGYWKQYCNDHLVSQGFTPIRACWSCFFHPQLKLFVVVYVDDFKMAGPTKNLQKGWELVRKEIRIEPPTPLGKYLGCNHVVTDRVFDISVPEHSMFEWPIRVPVKNLDVSPTDAATRGDSVAAPACPSGVNPPHGNLRKGRAHVRCLEYDMSEFLRSCVDRYKELAPRPITLRKVETPYLEEKEGPDGAEEGSEKPRGELQPIASKVLMKVLYAARMCRYDLLRACCFLATKVTKWDEACDRALHRLMCYINSTIDLKLQAWIGDPVESWTQTSLETRPHERAHRECSHASGLRIRSSHSWERARSRPVSVIRLLRRKSLPLTVQSERLVCQAWTCGKP